MCKKGDSLPHQKSRFFIASTGLGLSLNIWGSRKALKGLLQNMHFFYKNKLYKNNEAEIRQKIRTN